MMYIDKVLDSLRKGDFVLIYDGNDREREVDMVISGEYITPDKIARLRKDAGGLICLAISYDVAKNLGLKYMHEILSNEFDGLVYNKAPYGDNPSFSLTINHKNTYTGITDKDRALTIERMSKICKLIKEGYNAKSMFWNEFRTPGHVPLLIARRGLLKERRGHTELAITLAELAGLTPSMVICEMLDDNTHEALSLIKAKEYASRNGFYLIEGKELNEILKYESRTR